MIDKNRVGLLSRGRRFDRQRSRGDVPSANDSEADDGSTHPVVSNHNNRNRDCCPHRANGQNFDSLADRTVLLPIAKRRSEELVVHQPTLQTLVAFLETIKRHEDENESRKPRRDEPNIPNA